MFKYCESYKPASGNDTDRLALSEYDGSVGHLLCFDMQLVSHPAALDLGRSGRVESVLRSTKSTCITDI